MAALMVSRLFWRGAGLCGTGESRYLAEALVALELVGKSPLWRMLVGVAPVGSISTILTLILRHHTPVRRIDADDKCRHIVTGKGWYQSLPRQLCFQFAISGTRCPRRSR